MLVAMPQIERVGPLAQHVGPQPDLPATLRLLPQRTPLVTSPARTSTYTRGQHLVTRAVPTGKRIALKLSKIQNRREIEAQIANSPRQSPDERRILHHHLRRSSTSALFEKIRKKYPDYAE